MFYFHQIRTLEDARALPSGTIGIEIVDSKMAQAIITPEHGVCDCADQSGGDMRKGHDGRAHYETCASFRPLRGGGSNLDGQHGVPAGYAGTQLNAHTLGAWAGQAAVEIAAYWQCGERPTADGAYHVAFQRPDLDACAAAAVLVLRALDVFSGRRSEGIDGRLVPIDTATHDRIAMIARADSFRTEGLRWEDWAPPAPTVETLFPPCQHTTVDGSGELSAVAAICSPNVRTGQPELPLAERVAITACWLLWGYFNGITDTWVTDAIAETARRIFEACGCSKPQEDIFRFVDITHAGDCMHESMSRVQHARVQLIADTDCEVRHRSFDGGVAVVRTPHAGVSAFGYSRDRGAPVFVAIPPHPVETLIDACRHLAYGCQDESEEEETLEKLRAARVAVLCGGCGPRKVTIATCSSRYLDVPGLKAALNAKETEAGGVPKWGGPAGMVCSPMTEGTLLEDEIIIETVVAHRRG